MNVKINRELFNANMCREKTMVANKSLQNFRLKNPFPNFRFNPPCPNFKKTKLQVSSTNRPKRKLSRKTSFYHHQLTSIRKVLSIPNSHIGLKPGRTEMSLYTYHSTQKVLKTRKDLAPNGKPIGDAL